jgi:hypothetical protein
MSDMAVYQQLQSASEHIESNRNWHSLRAWVRDCAYIIGLGLGTVDSAAKTLECIADSFSDRPHSCESFWRSGAFNDCLRPIPSLSVLRSVAASNLSNWGSALPWWARFWYSRGLAAEFSEMALRRFFLWDADLLDSCRVG